MFYTRHFFIMLLSLVFIGSIVWWQQPGVAVSAMSQGVYHYDPEKTVTSFFKRMDTRQVDLVQKMIREDGNQQELTKITKMVENNPFISLQSLKVENAPQKNVFFVETIWKSVIDEPKIERYAIEVAYIDGNWTILSLRSTN